MASHADPGEGQGIQGWMIELVVGDRTTSGPLLEEWALSAALEDEIVKRAP